MKKTVLYQKIEKSYPGLLSKLLSPSRLRLMSNPEMIKSLISMDQVVENIRNQASLSFVFINKHRRFISICGMFCSWSSR